MKSQLNGRASYSAVGRFIFSITFGLATTVIYSFIALPLILLFGISGADIFDIKPTDSVGTLLWLFLLPLKSVVYVLEYVGYILEYVLPADIHVGDSGWGVGAVLLIIFVSCWMLFSLIFGVINMFYPKSLLKRDLMKRDLWY